MNALITFDQLWRRAEGEHGNRPFLLFRDRGRADVEWSYAEFERLVEAVAVKLTQLEPWEGR